MTSTSPRRHLIAGSIAVAVYAGGAVVIHSAYAFDAKSSLSQNGGRGASLSQQSDRLSREAARDSADRAALGRKYANDPRTKQVSTKDTNNGGSADYGGDRTGGGGGPK
jgi:hypothetical protein